MNAIAIGRSNLVGRPLVQLLNENATVTIAHRARAIWRTPAPAPIGRRRRQAR
jgi:5,10-methylene-tetrahydrofolate dehydrogenase/methenyl tetrahydrofolate cyclohydrolase